MILDFSIVLKKIRIKSLLYKKYKSSRAVGFCTSRHHAEYMAKSFCENGIKAVAVYSGENGEYSADRNEALSKLAKGEVQVLFSVDMFNEGLDIPAIDMVMFLRPTQSPTVFLQQLGRGLRKYKDKEYLNVLDFIGNYKKANLIPFLLSGQTYSKEASKNNNQGDYSYPDDCFVDFDFKLVDIFKSQAEKEMTIRDRIKEEYYKVKEELGHVPSRIELFNNMDEDVYDNIKSKVKGLSPFSNYLEFLDNMNELSDKENKLYNSRAREFINMIETTAMSKSYKMPVLLAFYNNGDIKLAVTEEDIYHSFYEFYHQGTNKVDMLRDKSTKDFMNWNQKQYISLAKRMPIKVLLNTHSDFFKEKEGYILALADDIKEFISNEVFKEQVKDAIDFRVTTYYRNRFMNKDK